MCEKAGISPVPDTLGGMIIALKEHHTMQRIAKGVTIMYVDASEEQQETDLAGDGISLCSIRDVSYYYARAMQPCCNRTRFSLNSWFLVELEPRVFSFQILGIVYWLQ